MTKRNLWLGILVIVLVFGITVVGCGDDGNDSSGGSAALGDTLSLTGQVYTEIRNENTFSLSYSEFTGSIPSFNTGIGGTGGIINGQLNFFIDTPSSLTTDWWWDEYATVSPSSTRGEILWLGTDNGSLWKENNSLSGNENRGSETGIYIEYIYVDRDVTISAPMYNDSGTEDGISWNERVNAYTLNFKKGWNVIHYSDTFSWTENSRSGTDSIFAGEPRGLRWVWMDMSNYSYSNNLAPQTSPSSYITNSLIEKRKEEWRKRFYK